MPPLSFLGRQGIAFLCLLLLASLSASAQFESAYPRLIQEGDSVKSLGNYDLAIKKYQAAGRADPALVREANARIDLVFRLIEKQRVEADSAFQAAEKSKREALIAKGKVEKALVNAQKSDSTAKAARDEAKRELEKSQRLSHFFFEEDSPELTAWAYGTNGKFAIVNREGERLGDFEWEVPTPFVQGIARARRGGLYYVIGESGEPVSEGYVWLHPTDLPYWAALKIGDEVFEYVVLNEQDFQEVPDTGLIFRSPSSLPTTDSSQGLADNLPLQNASGLSNYPTKFLSKEVDGKWGFVNELKQWVVAAIYTEVLPFERGFARVRKGAKRWGVIDTSGAWVIRPRYQEIESLSGAEVFPVRRKEKWGLINLQGKVMVSPNYEWINNHFKGPFTIAKEPTGKLVSLNSAGQILHRFDGYFDYTGSRVRFRQGKRYGYLDPSGKPLTDSLYSETTDYFFGFAGVRDSRYSPFYFIDTLGQKVLFPLYQEYLPMEGSVIRVKENDRFGLIDATGNVLLPPRYDGIYIAKEGLYLTYQNGEVGVVNRQGKTRIPPGIYDEIGRFSQGLARAKKGDLVGLVDSLGKVVLPMQYLDVVYRENSPVFVIEKHPKAGKDGISNQAVIGLYLNPDGSMAFPQEKAGLVGDGFREGRAGSSRGKYYGFIDRTGQLVIPAQYLAVDYFSEGLAAVQTKDSTLQYLDRDGNIVLDKLPYAFLQKEDMKFHRGLARVLLNGKVGLINRAGRELFPPDYEQVTVDTTTGAVFLKQKGKYALASVNGAEKEILTGFNFDSLFTKKGLVYGKIAGRIGLYTLTGKKILPPQYDQIIMTGPGAYRLGQSGQVGLLLLQDWVYNTPESTRTDCIQTLIPCEYEDLGRNYQDDLIPAKQNGKWGFLQRITVQGQPDEYVTVIPHRYQAVTPFFTHKGQGYARVSEANVNTLENYQLSFFINEKGEALLKLGPQNPANKR